MKKGFTLVEVLAVVVILGLLVAIISPVVNNLLGDSEDVLRDKQVDSIVKASKKYMVEHSELLPEKSDSTAIYISDLIDNGVIDNDEVINPKTKEEMNGCVVVNYNESFNQYEYNYRDDCSINITFDPEGGSVDTTSKKVMIGKTYGELPTPTRDGYTFKGWRGKNIIDKSQSTKEGIRNETPFNSWGTTAFDNNWVLNNLQPSTQYTISFDVEGISIPEHDSNFANNLGFLIYSPKTTPHTVMYLSKYIAEGEKIHITRTITTPQNVNVLESKYVIYAYSNRYLKNQTGVYSTIRIYNLQLEEGDSVTEFEPYQEFTSDTVVTKGSDYTLHAIWEVAS